MTWTSPSSFRVNVDQRWDVKPVTMSSKTASRGLDEALDASWEPFSVTRAEGSYATVWLRRRRRDREA